MMRIISHMERDFSNLGIEDIRDLEYMEERLDILHDDVLVWDSDRSMIWDCDPVEAVKYLSTVDEVQKIIKILETFKWTENFQLLNDLLCHAYTILQMTMSKLEEEFVHLLVQCRQISDSDHMSFRSSVEFSDDLSSSSFGADLIRGKLHRESCNYLEEFAIDLIIPSAHPDIKCIAEAMFMSRYDKELCQVYIDVRKDALDECLSFLHVEKLSIEEVLQMDWNSIYSKISRWNKVIKIFVRVNLVSEKRLCDHIFGDFSEEASRTCFIESAKNSTLQLLTFGEAIAVGPCTPEKLFRILDMYEALTDLVPEIEALFQEVSDPCILIECHDLMSRLGEFARASLTEFKYAIQNNASTTAFSGGGIHPLTTYVMNYVNIIPDYSDTLNLLLKGLYTCDTVEEDTEISDFSPITSVLHSIASILELNLNGKSLLYQDPSLQHLFMMNNIYYMVRKVKDSDLQALLGDDWLRAEKRKYHQHALSYERGSWNPILSFLKDEGIKNPITNTPSKKILKERLHNFNHAFEELYKTQTGWRVSEAPLREDLQISISQNLLNAYRTFTGRYASHLDNVRHRERYIKFTQDDLQNYILDLFGGSSKSPLNSFRR